MQHRSRVSVPTVQIHTVFQKPQNHLLIAQPGSLENSVLFTVLPGFSMLPITFGPLELALHFELRFKEETVPEERPECRPVSPVRLHLKHPAFQAIHTSYSVA